MRWHPPGTVPIEVWLAEHPEAAVAWDRDEVASAHRWTSDEDGCECGHSHGPYVYPKGPLGEYPFVTDGHGTALRWVPDASDPLGGHWVLATPGRLAYRIVGNKPVDLPD